MCSNVSYNSISVLRRIVEELRRSNSKLRPISKTTAFSYLMHEFRSHQLTGKQTCKSSDELYLMAKAYLCYLQSVREHQELLKQFYIKGERSVEDTAKLVGFALPDGSKDKPDNN